MATFNWPPLVFNTGVNAWVSPAGSDLNTISANSPYRTIQKCIDQNLKAIHLGNGVFSESLSNMSISFISGEYNSIIDMLQLSTHFIGYGFENIKIINGKLSTTNDFVFLNVFFKGYLTGSVLASQYNGVKNSTFISATPHSTFYFQTTTRMSKCTLINQYIRPSSTVLYPNGQNENIFIGCNIHIATVLTDQMSFDFNLYQNCSFKFGADASFLTQAQLESTYGVSGIAAVKAYYNAKFGTSNVFNYSKVADPLFNNAALDDYTLQPLSPARHMAYDGTYIGAKDVGFPSYAYANDLGQPNAFYNASKNANTLVANNSITLVRNPDGSAQGSGAITEKPKDLGLIFELKTNQSSYIQAYRNREMLDNSADIDLSAPIAAGTALTSGVIYVNEGGSVVYNSVTYSNRSRITAVDSLQSFTTTEGAVLYAITEYPNRYTNLIRHKQTIVGTQIAAGTDVLTADSWYRVYSNSITWDGKTVPVGDSFQAVAGKLSFSGSGVCVAEFTAADAWSEVIIDAPIKCRRVGNVSTGAIDAGTDGKPLTNGHKEYYNATNKARAEFSIFARYVQKHWVLNAKMLK